MWQFFLVIKLECAFTLKTVTSSWSRNDIFPCLKLLISSVSQYKNCKKSIDCQPTNLDFFLSVLVIYYFHFYKYMYTSGIYKCSFLSLYYMLLLILHYIHVHRHVTYRKGPVHVNNFLTECNIPPISETTLYKKEKEISKSIHDVAMTSCREAQRQEILDYC